jgi:DNA-binding winged helix-turn-helix (wHTH) protein/tetratricopeptide (TPR) repeat protein/TolB-like protein
MNGSRTESRYLYEFDGFRADPVRRRLSRGGEVVSLTPKAFSILLALLEKRGQVVPKEDLIQQIWPDTFVTEANLTQNISSLRKALGERANDPRFVITVPGQGYSFVADVLEIPRDGTGEMPAFVLPPLPALALVESAAEASPIPYVAPPAPLPLEEPEPEPALVLPAATVPPVSPGAAAAPAPSLLEDTGSFRPTAPPVAIPPIRRRSRQALWLALLAVLLVAVPRLYIYSLGRDPSPAAQANAPLRPDRASIAVLGFTNLSGNPQAAWLADALPEMLTTELQTGGKARMIKGENVNRARAALSLPEGANLRSGELERLHAMISADLIVVGSYLSLGERAGGRVRLDLQVIKVPSGETVVRLPMMGTETELLDLVSRTGAGLRRELRWAPPSPAQAREAEALRPANPEATRHYVAGLAKLRAFDPRGAREILEQAAAADPRSAIIRSGLAQAWSDLGYDARAAAESEKAVQLSGSLSKQEQLTIQARSYESKRDWDKASELYRSLWNFFPDDLDYGLLLANALIEAGHVDEAMEAVKLLRGLPAPKREDPRIDLAEAKAARRRWDPERTLRAAKAAEIKGWKLEEPQVVAQALALEGQSCHVMGRLDEAIKLFQQAKALFAKSGNQAQVATMVSWIGVTLDDQGKLALAQKQFEEALVIADQLGSKHLVANQRANLGLLRQEAGDLAQARTMLAQAEALYKETGDPWLGKRTSYFIGQVLWQQGDVEGARERYDQVLSASRASGSRIEEAVALAGQGQILAHQGQLATARRSHQKALGIAEQLHDPYRTAGIQASLAEVTARLGDLDGAEQLFERALESRRQIGGQIGVAEILGSLSELAYSRGDLARARETSREQLRIAQGAGAQLLAAAALQNLGRVELAEGDRAIARQHFEKALSTAIHLGGALSAAALRLDLARLELLDNRPAQSILLTREAADWYGRRQMPGEQARALALLAEGVASQGNLRAARDPAERARALAERSDDSEVQVAVTTSVARVDAAAGGTKGPQAHLGWAVEQAGKAGLVPAGFEARLALGTVRVATVADRPAGLQVLEALRRDAAERGFKLMAQRAEAVLKAATLGARPLG